LSDTSGSLWCATSGILSAILSINGVRAFLSGNHSFPFNNKVKSWLKIKDYLSDEDVVCQWKDVPSVRCYYVTWGDGREHSLHNELVEQFIKDEDPNYRPINFHLCGADEFKEILDRNENKFTATIPFMDTMALPETPQVTNSCMALCKAEDFIKLLDTKEGIIKKSLFNDNVRDFQGDNAVNNEIFKTAKDNPSRFVLFNNGITIVCSSFISSNRILKLENPQIVNGCQTSHILFNASKNGVNLGNITVLVKVISTDNLELSNDIVRGTNRQNIVMEEAFEATSSFHKMLEEFINAYENDSTNKIYYERRAKQYANNPNIKQSQKFNLKILTQYFVGSVFMKPYWSHLHESFLLKQFKGKIFREKDSCMPYFAVAYTFLLLESFLHQHKLPPFFKTYKAHLMMIYFKLAAGELKNLQVSKQADEYANKILKYSFNDESALELFKESVKKFDECSDIWVKEYGKNKHAMKDTPLFTELLLKHLDHVPLDGIKSEINKQSQIMVGKVKNIIFNGSESFGFIETDDDKNIFFTKKRNPYLDFKRLNHRTVSFKMTLKDNKNRIQAYDVRLKK
jgi:cold shock CspA family protein